MNQNLLESNNTNGAEQALQEEPKCITNIDELVLPKHIEFELDASSFIIQKVQKDRFENLYKFEDTLFDFCDIKVHKCVKIENG